jgi:hypothetical protein
MLFTADVSAATTAKPFPTSPNTHSIFLQVSFLSQDEQDRERSALIDLAWIESVEREEEQERDFLSVGVGA